MFRISCPVCGECCPVGDMEEFHVCHNCQACFSGLHGLSRRAEKRTPSLQPEAIDCRCNGNECRIFCTDVSKGGLGVWRVECTDLREGDVLTLRRDDVGSFLASVAWLKEERGGFRAGLKKVEQNQS